MVDPKCVIVVTITIDGMSTFLTSSCHKVLNNIVTESVIYLISVKCKCIPEHRDSSVLC